MKNLLLTIQLLLLILSCNNYSQPPDSYNVDNISSEGILINKWRVVGPFRKDTVNNNFETNNLSELGYNQSTLSYNDFKSINSNSDSSFTNTVITSYDHKIDFNKIFVDSASNPKNGVAYAGCVINSSIKRNLKLNFSSNGGSKIWLNNKLVFSDEKGEALRLYENYIDLDINRGANFLLVRVNNLQNTCGMFAAIEKRTQEGIRRHRNNFHLDFGNSFLYRNVIENDSIKLIWEMPKGKYKLELTGPQKASYQIKTDEYINIAHLPDGLYTTKFYARGDTFNSRFYKGDIIRKIDDLIKSIKAHRAYKENNTVDALEFRFKHLIKPENIGKESYEKRAWGKKMTSLLINLNIQYGLLNKSLTPSEATGGLLRSYVSEIDHGVQYYQLHVPNNYNPDKPVPMVIELPKFMKRFESPLQSFRFANIDLFEQFTDLANKYNMLVLDPCSRIIDKQNHNGIDEADLWEAIKDIKRDFNIDTTRMYLRGACLSSHEALNLAVRYPGKFAAISTIAPQFTRSKDLNIWLQQNFPINFLANSSDLPFYNIHSKIDKHSPFEVSEQLNVASKKAGLTRFSFKTLPFEFKPFYSEEHLDDIFRFFSSSHLSRRPEKVRFETNQLKYNQSFWITLDAIESGETASIIAHIQNNVLNIKNKNILSYSIDLKKLPYNHKAPLKIVENGRALPFVIRKGTKLVINAVKLSPDKRFKTSEIEGPFAHVFTKSFILVPGTNGTKEEQRQIKAIVDTLNNHWKNRYYANLRIKYDNELTKADIQSANLILIGSPKSNLVFQSLLNRLPIKIEEKFIEIGNKRLNGNNLNYYLIYPNPVSLNRYVSVIGYNSITPKFSLGTEEDITKQFNDISNYGWYDYKIWDREFARVITGNFNYKWQ